MCDSAATRTSSEITLGRLVKFNYVYGFNSAPALKLQRKSSPRLTCRSQSLRHPNFQSRRTIGSSRMFSNGGGQWSVARTNTSHGWLARLCTDAAKTKRVVQLVHCVNPITITGVTQLCKSLGYTTTTQNITGTPHSHALPPYRLRFASRHRTLARTTLQDHTPLPTCLSQAGRRRRRDTPRLAVDPSAEQSYLHAVAYTTENDLAHKHTPEKTVFGWFRVR